MIGAAVLQKAIYTALNGISVAVFDDVPATNTLKKYVTIGTSPFGRPFDTHDSEGSERFPQIDVWHNPEDSVKGMRTVQLIMDEVDARLHNAKLPLDAGHMLSLQLDFDQVTWENVNGKRWNRGIMRYRALISE